MRETANLPADEPLEFRDEVFYLSNGRRLMDLIEFADKWGFYWGGGDPLVVSASFPDTFAPSPYVATCAEVEVDKRRVTIVWCICPRPSIAAGCSIPSTHGCRPWEALPNPSE